MNTSNQNSKPNCVVHPSRNSSWKKGKLSALRELLVSFHLVMWLAGIIVVLCGTPVVRADFLPGNFWTNSAFELGSNLDQTDDTVSNWNRGGGDPTICQVITNNSVSSSHSLAVIDTNSGP